MNRFEKKKLHVINNNEFTDKVNVLDDASRKNLVNLRMEKTKLAREYEKVTNFLNLLLDEEHQLTNQIMNVNRQICAIEGHKFDSGLSFSTKAYGETYKCLECGMLVASHQITERDTFITSKAKGPVRILYKK